MKKLWSCSAGERLGESLLEGGGERNRTRRRTLGGPTLTRCLHLPPPRTGWWTSGAEMEERSIKGKSAAVPRPAICTWEAHASASAAGWAPLITAGWVGEVWRSGGGCSCPGTVLEDKEEAEEEEEQAARRLGSGTTRRLAIRAAVGIFGCGISHIRQARQGGIKM